MKSIDERLKADGQQTIARLVAGLEEEAPSLQWRSGLNEALFVRAKQMQRRKRFFFVARPMLGLAAACALAVIVTIRPHGALPGQTAQISSGQVALVAESRPMEAALVDLHRDDLRAIDVAGAGLNPNDTATDQSSSGATSSTDDSEADLEL
jgi:hypothetical protein